MKPVHSGRFFLFILVYKCYLLPINIIELKTVKIGL